MFSISRKFIMEITVEKPRGDSMKKLIPIAGILFIFCAARVAMAQENMSGIWDEDAQSQRTSEISRSVIIYAQFGNKLRATGFFEYKGDTCVWAGTGTVDGKAVEHSVNYSKWGSLPGYKDADGGFVLTLSPDGRTLTGTWHSNNGGSGTKKFVKRK
jgi:hypothetical protein